LAITRLSRKRSTVVEGHFEVVTLRVAAIFGCVRGRGLPWERLWNWDLKAYAIACVELDLIIEADRGLPPPKQLLHSLLIADSAPQREAYAAVVGAYMAVRPIMMARLERAVGDLVAIDVVELLLRLRMAILRRVRSRDRIKSRCNPLVGRRGIELELLENV
jgi:hypothetical protein